MQGATLSGLITFVEFGSGRLPSLTNPIKLSGRSVTIPESVNWKLKLEISHEDRFLCFVDPVGLGDGR